MNEYWHATGLFAPNLRPVCRISADFHAAYLASLLAELEVEATAVPPGDGGVGGEGGLAEDG